MNDTSDLKQNYSGVFDGHLGFGRAPAIIVVDFIKAYTQPGAPLYALGVVEAVKATVPLSCPVNTAFPSAVNTMQ